MISPMDVCKMKDVWKAVAAAAVFAVVLVLLWELLLKGAWSSAALLRAHHYWYGIVLVLGSFALHILRVDKRIIAFLCTAGLVWFGSDFPDFVAHFGWVVTIIVVVLLALIPIVMIRKHSKVKRS